VIIPQLATLLEFQYPVMSVIWK